MLDTATASAQWLPSGHEQLKPSASLADAVALVDGFVPQDSAQQDARDHVLRFAADHRDALHRSCLSGHFTASAWVVNHHTDAGLVLLHAKIGRWLQPGGHADGDACLAAVALRECSEETGIAGLQIWSEPVDIDVHSIAATGGGAAGTTTGNAAGNETSPAEPDHLHLDVRFVVRAPSDAVVSGNHESEQLRWVGEVELGAAWFGLDNSTLRLAHFGFACARSNPSDKQRSR